MACLFAAKLAAHTQVTMLGSWPAGIQALQTLGVTLVTDNGEITRRVVATSNPLDCPRHRHALVLVKSWQTARAADLLHDCLAPDGVALTLQNGCGNLEILRVALGAERAAMGITTIGATLLAPAKVRDGGNGSICLLPSEKLEPLTALFHLADMPVKAVEDIDSLAWGKLIISVAINPLTAILRVPNGHLLEDLHAKELMVAAANEAIAITAALGVPLPFADPLAALAEVVEKTAANYSSMLQDVIRKAPTEIDVTCGTIARHGERLNIDTPVNNLLWKLIAAMPLADPEARSC